MSVRRFRGGSDTVVYGESVFAYEKPCQQAINYKNTYSLETVTIILIIVIMMIVITMHIIYIYIYIC